MLTFLRFRKMNGPSVLCFVLQVCVKKRTYLLLTSFRISNRNFVDVLLLNAFFDLILFDELDDFCR